MYPNNPWASLSPGLNGDFTFMSVFINGYNIVSIYGILNCRRYFEESPC